MTSWVRSRYGAEPASKPRIPNRGGAGTSSVDHPGRVLVEVARDSRLLTLGARKHTGVGRLLAGSASHYCLSHSTVPVAAVPAQDAEGVPTQSDEIVLGLDDSPSGVEALTWAAGLARTSGPTPTGHPPPRLAQGIRTQALSDAARALSHPGAGRSRVPGQHRQPVRRARPRAGLAAPSSPRVTPARCWSSNPTSSTLLVVGTQKQALAWDCCCSAPSATMPSATPTAPSSPCRPRILCKPKGHQHDEGTRLRRSRQDEAGRTCLYRTLQDADDAIVRVDAVTICGTDLHILKGDVPAVETGPDPGPRGGRHGRRGRAAASARSSRRRAGC